MLNQLQASCRVCTPGVELTGDRLAGQSERALAQQGIKGRVLGESLARPALHEPVLIDNNLNGLAWHIRGITALAIAFVVVGALIRLGGLG